MATHTISRSFLRSPTKSLSTLFTRSFSSSAPLAKTTPASSLLTRSRPLVAALSSVARGGFVSLKGLSTQATSSSLNDPNPNWSNRPPKETILLDGCDFEHWLVVMEPPEGDLTRDEIIDGYIKTLAQIVGSEEEARMKIYSVSTRCYFAFGALVSEDLSHKLKELPKVRWVLPDSYLDVRNKDYGGEPFIDGKAVPYDPKYHEEWIRNNARANERNRRNDRPRNFDRSRSFERRRENPAGGPPQRSPMGSAPPPPPHMGGSAPPPPHMGQNHGGPPPPQNNMGGQRPPPNYGGGPPQNNMGGQMPPANYGGAPPPNYGGPPPPNYGGAPPQNNMGGAPPPPNYGGAPPQNSMGGGPPNAGWSGNNYQQQSGGMQQQPQYQNNYPPNRDGSGNPYQG
ncbi:unnamed protein product [Eruca vesicaria subsp. sativa]|uniref:MORF/ORRM1/DAG-like MORF domain-containing protein n=1 Tax=Eruca vesicaria subsp. sativa TaxID=29727 RepID=A0ABC8KIC1_ERUVS|nr:unnamed protein product [Eruca vesicaria subsp. sativa]